MSLKLHATRLVALLIKGALKPLEFEKIWMFYGHSLEDFIEALPYEHQISVNTYIHLSTSTHIRRKEK